MERENPKPEDYALRSNIIGALSGEDKPKLTSKEIVKRVYGQEVDPKQKEALLEVLWNMVDAGVVERNTEFKFETKNDKKVIKGVKFVYGIPEKRKNT